MRGRGFTAAVVAAALAIAALTGFARAQDVYVTYRVNNWTLAPAITGQAVKGFLAYADPTSVTGSNITVVWYQREADGSWTTWAWTGYDLCGATLYLRGLLSDRLVFEDEPVLSAAAWDGCAAHLPKQVVNGLFFDDPAQPLVQGSPEPEALVSALVDVGWEAAPDLSPLAVAAPVVCTEGQAPKDAVKALMDVETYWTEIALFGASTVDLLCNSAPCNGCQTIYGARTPASGSSWVLHSRIVLPDGRTMCCYDRDAVQNWHEVGLSYIFCNACNATGTIHCTLHAQTFSGAGDGDCHPPP